MSGINSLSPSTAGQFQIRDQSEINKFTSLDSALKGAAIQSSADADAGSQISSFSQALSDVAIRAAERDASLSRYELSKIVHSTVEKLFGERYQMNKTRDDAEVPSSSDPQRLAQARQATDYLHNRGTNPFKGMPSDQLALIIYDESATFTPNERRAAYDESSSQHQAWKVAVAAKAMDDYGRSGKISSACYQLVLDHYKSLPPIEASQFPDEYETELQNRIDHNGPDLPQNNNRLESFFDLLIKRLNDHQPSSAHL
ncbi:MULTISPECIES: hypothetical protein [unclassified Pseudomonas]|uniref:hypothetical protein n=1 Tax=unclassified Pseudomonas TaxID=196821 RepID=UPI000BCDB73C|nr:MULTISPECIES: hypothetical protein [unclassified Pseudomonas]PVZ20403.1 hypothetical protein F474_01003 [Pseudomonas sp. URIL14HWK12:I12]PVZ27469.1 hypothetical protein F470_00658 [Pseudomonas sp. URIL14HWK12:I10]PVZ38358.1 hypothetical protein F472_01003 [Pseudomonas sp. URIL14HWK12:I11]SNZ03675.1 hypothetical protein SAMN05660463_00401 [Pseudomonas sp. URIL14HWK12:I9]